MQGHQRKSDLKTIVAVVVLIFFLSCTNDLDKQHLGLALKSDIQGLDPVNAFDVVSSSVIHQIYEPLYEYQYLKRPYDIRPLLAQGLPIIENEGQRYTIKIREQIPYHPIEGLEKRFVEAQDFITQFKRLAFKPNNSSGWWLFSDRIKGLDRFRDKVGRDREKFWKYNVSGLRAPDKQTLVIELTKPYPQLIYALAMSFTTPIPAEALKMKDFDLTTQEIGTGPFILQKWSPDKEIKLKRNPSYKTSVYPSEGDRWALQNQFLEDAGKKLPFLETITFRVIPNTQEQWEMFQDRKIDITNLTRDQYPVAINEIGKLRANFVEQGIELKILPTLTSRWLSFNMTDAILGKKILIRKAIAHALDFERFIQEFTFNVALKANSIFLPSIPGYLPSHRLSYEYNLEKAKLYLKQAGHALGKGLPTFEFATRNNDDLSIEQAKWIKNELAKIGLKIKISVLSFPSYLDRLRKGDLVFYQDGWTMDYPDPQNVLQILYGGNLPPGPNSTQFQNKQFDKLYRHAAQLSLGEKKETLLGQMEDIIERELPWIMQLYSREYILHHEQVKNFRPSDMIYNSLKYLKIEKQ